MVLICSVLFLLLFQSNTCVKYKGESFPTKYLRPDDQKPEYSDVTYYLKGINNMLNAMARHANKTDINRALGMFFMKAVLKRTIRDNNHKIQEEQRKLLNKVLLQAEDVMSHFYSSMIKPLKWADTLKRAGVLLKNDNLQMEAIQEFKRDRLGTWILSNVTFNEFEKDMDELKLIREKYLSLTEEVIDFEKNKKYTISIDDSDYCIGEVIYNPMPLDSLELKPCVYDKFCSAIVYKRAPSFSYSLSHRMLNIMLVHHMRRCYLRSPEDDEAMMEAMCSSMYREAVYLARRGYFARDLWMEHIALCALFGYEEFFRRHWFRKVVSWIDEGGCLAENFNYEANRTRYLLSQTTKPKQIKRIRHVSDKVLASKCHWHPMALGLVVLAHGVRHALQFSENIIKDEL